MKCRNCLLWSRCPSGDTTLGECLKQSDILSSGWHDAEEMAKHEACLYRIIGNRFYSHQYFSCSHYKKSDIHVVASGGFDPLHVGHVEYLEKAKSLGTRLTVIVNSDRFLIQKKGYAFMPIKERMKIVGSLKCVDNVFESIDSDMSVCSSLAAIRPNLFAKGGDRNASNIPEASICEKLGIKIIDGLGEKIQSSSSLIKKLT